MCIDFPIFQVEVDGFGGHEQFGGSRRTPVSPVVSATFSLSRQFTVCVNANFCDLTSSMIGEVSSKIWQVLA